MLTRADIISHLNETDPVKIAALFAEANRVREEFMGPEVHLRGLIEISNHCRRECQYCGLQKSNSQLTRYRMDLDDIFESAKLAESAGIKTVVLQSGEDMEFTIEELAVVIHRIKAELKMAVTASFGELSFEDYKALREAGADRYLLKFETTDRNLFKKLKPDSIFEERFQCLLWLKELGYQVGSGAMVGLPGQTNESIANDILTYKELELDMIGIGPFIPHPNTALKNATQGSLEMVLKAVALTRILTQNTHMPATTATGTIDPIGRQRALQCGANVLMPNFSPQKFREQYEIYPSRICIHESPEKCTVCTRLMVESLGRTVGCGYGHSFK